MSTSKPDPRAGPDSTRSATARGKTASPTQSPVERTKSPFYPLDDGVAIEIGDDDYSDGSSIASSADSDTTSLSSSVFNYVYENGRRYASHRSGNYVLPNDEEEQERLDLTHHVYTDMLGGELFVAPIKYPKNVLDLGCGTGMWAIEMGDTYPDCTIIGTDLSPIQPAFVPPNVQFEVDNWEDEWMFGKKFDLIHMRALQGAVKDFSELYRKAWKNLEPGGWLEIVETHIVPYSEDNTYETKAHDLQTYFKHLCEGGEKIGCRLDQTAELKAKVEAAGFINVEEKIYKSPVGSWPKDPRWKEIGKIMLSICLIGAESYGLALFTRALGMSEKEAESVIDAARKQISNNKIHTLYRQHVIVGQKPKE